LLRRAVEADRLFSAIILWGPPGTGKTTLARIITNRTQSHFETISAVLAGIPELRRVIADAKERRKRYNAVTTSTAPISCPSNGRLAQKTT
jgi:putative ATPase